MRRVGFWLTRFWLTPALLAGVLAGCGGDQDTATGALQVDISGVPVGTGVSVGVTGPNFTQQLTQSGTLNGLAAGVYTVSPGAASGYTASVSGSPATVSAGATTRVSVTYQQAVSAGGSISGTVSIVGATAEMEAEFVPGEVIVKFRTGVWAQAVEGLEPLRDLPLEGVGLYRLSSALRAQSTDLKTDTLRLVAQLSARGDVLYAHPNYLLGAYAEPNDPRYTEQWHYGAINLPAAWNQTTGSADVTVAVLDSGIVPTHPDLTSKIAPGYDFVSSAQFSGDGDGRDGDPTDPAGSFHGSHVAGTVAAATDNGVGVAGVSWGSRILPVRVLGGDGGGDVADAVDGILWSVGESVTGVPTNRSPADVLNLSLGGPLPCTDVPALQDAFDQANAAGAVVVVAAGNDGADASSFTPASCSGVIAVGATDVSGERAFYSNYGARIDVMAPGGDLTGGDSDANGYPDGVLSTVQNAAGEPDYTYLDGTSMASPHVAGVVALMKSVQPTLSGAEARDILKSTARSITDASCAVGCGAGLIDAAAALSALGSPTTPDFTLSLSPATLSLTAGASASTEVLISRSGGFSSAVAFSVSGLPVGLSASFTPPATTGDSARLTLSATAGVTGVTTLQVQGVGGGISKTAPLSVVIGGGEPTPVEDIAGTVVVACYYVSNTCDQSLSKGVNITQSGTSAPYTISSLSAGSYLVGALKDGNGDGDYSDAEDYLGFHLQNGQQTLVTPPVTGIDVGMTPALSTQEREAVVRFWEERR